MPIFLSRRHPDTMDLKGPYRVFIRQISGARIGNGEVVCLARNTSGQEFALRSQLHQTPSDSESAAEIPGQPQGTSITY